MKFTINRNEFTKVLLSVSRIIQPRGINNILTNVKLVLDTNGLSITGSTDEFTIVQTIPLFNENKEIIRDVRLGGVLVNAKILCDVARKLDGEELTFELIDDSVVKINNNKTVFRLNSTRVEEYVDIDFSQIGAHLTLDTDLFVKAINSVSFAASIKNNRPLLTCVNINCSNGYLDLTATDGARLANKKIEVNNNENFNVNIPGKTIIEVVKSISNEKTIDLYVSANKILFILDKQTIVARLITGDYPNTKNIIPKQFFYYLEVNSEEFLNAIDRISLLSAERENVVRVIMTTDGVEISSKSQQIGSAVENLNQFKYQGERLQISFNAEFVSSAIKALNSEDVLLSFIADMKPFTVTNKNDQSAIQLITPLRTY